MQGTNKIVFWRRWLSLFYIYHNYFLFSSLKAYTPGRYLYPLHRERSFFAFCGAHMGITYETTVRPIPPCRLLRSPRIFRSRLSLRTAIANSHRPYQPVPITYRGRWEMQWGPGGCSSGPIVRRAGAGAAGGALPFADSYPSITAPVPSNYVPNFSKVLVSTFERYFIKMFVNFLVTPNARRTSIFPKIYLSRIFFFLIKYHLRPT